MIEASSAYIALFGDFFSPKEVEEKTGLVFKKKHEVGELGSYGRFKGKKYPFGHAVLEAPEDLPWQAQLEWLLEFVLPHTAVLRSHGVTDGKIHITYTFDDQCNLEYEPELVEKLARFGFRFTVSCY